jgi:hypothetical protein
MAAKPGQNEEKLRDKNGRISSKRSEAPLSRAPVQLPVHKQSRLLSERMVFSITLHEGSLLISLSGGAPLEAGGLFIEAIAPSSPCLGKLRAGDQLAAVCCGPSSRFVWTYFFRLGPLLCWACAIEMQECS